MALQYDAMSSSHLWTAAFVFAITLMIQPYANAHDAAGHGLGVRQPVGSIEFVPRVAHPALFIRAAQDDDPAKRPLNICPERVGASAFACEQCNGESHPRPGHCSNSLGCVCDYPPNPPQGKTITTTVNNQPVTATFQAQKLSEYGALKQSLTVTKTATKTDDAGAVETVALVVFAGGVAWFLADYVGATAAGNELEPPKENPPDSDDKDCPGQKPKCDDCGAELGFCTTGDQQGCSCDNKDQCPEEGSNDQPKCSDESCLGQKDGKCTVGDHKDCSCGKEQCPKEGDQQPSCKDESCKAKDGKCTEGEHKDCECKNTCPKTEEEEVPKCSDEKCQGVNTGKCTADGDLKDCECVKRECPDLKKEIFFCSQCGGKNEQDKCKGIDDENLKGLWKDCDCIPDPDWTKQPKPLVRQDVAKHQKALAEVPMRGPDDDKGIGKPVCLGNDATPIPRDVFSPGVYSQFCEVVKKNPKELFSLYVDAEGNPIVKKRSAKVRRADNADAKKWKDWKFSLIWTGGDGSCKSDCSETFKSIADSECGHQGENKDTMKQKGAFLTGCGLYTYEIEKLADTPDESLPPEENGQTHCISEEHSYEKFMRKFDRDAADKKIEQFCNDLTSGNKKPLRRFPDEYQLQIQSDDLSDDKSWFSTGVMYIDQWNACKQPVDFGLKGMKERCLKNIRVAMDSCSESEKKDKFWKWGGDRYDQCVTWFISANTVKRPDHEPS